ncbi:hypothetical protein IFM89_009822 [Coptis chinensis]|uniref:Peptidase M48 domain-containing protein n=1 Tax=Coptis chinensis TaxID=261450 RepID=A0A835M2M1_9MAGN|nr:hypothetical protein IFM89_009822 [Coptis chinensis]
MSWYRRAKLGITSFHNLTNSTAQLYGKTIVPTCKPPTTSFQRYYLSDYSIVGSVIVVASGIMVASGIGTLYAMFCYRGLRIVNVPFTNWKLPFTNRKRLVLPTTMHKRIGDDALEGCMIEYKGKLLDEKNPHSVRAKLILKNIIQGLERQVKCNPNSNVSGYYYDGFNWNILVVNNCIAHAHCIPGGTIFISVGALQAFTDGEVAACIAHEVGHIVARHTVEFQHPNLNRCKREFEADYIGLLLMASAGYNPQIVVEFWKNMILRYPDFSKEDHEHPSYEERANSLAQAHVMEQALTIYKESWSEYFVNLVFKRKA